MTVSETVLVFVGLPALVILVVGGLAYLGERAPAGGQRYRPGRPYEAEPVWFVAAEDRDATPAIAGRAALPAAGVTGGASDRW
ncbi:hypothetical protein GCM10010124_33860 [Pilimelia terevasa]|uniref:Uncharacterized protein n=1 Tax=Pilimelia terevasa TaxID=53372 RepID=A0A8J3BUE1_9ACTN|nr:hypothetical protein [Pilimelia terevasa]GGK38266.1 hypothetical protein GCM10010124_33860 [Pilimelia terevasa]